MAKVTITTDDGEVIEILNDDDLPVSNTRLSMVSLSEQVWEAIETARQKERI
jgi:hypothetical protein